MTQNIEFILSFASAKKLISTDSSASLKEVYTKMLYEEVSLVPIIDNNNKKHVGLYRRKKLFEWFIKNSNKEIESVPKSYFKENPLPAVDMQTSLKEAMLLLHNNSAILVKNNDGSYTHLITPRVIANALEVYAVRFMVYESLEKTIRKKITDNNILINLMSSSNPNLPFPKNPNELMFSQYITIFSKKWEELQMSHLDKKTILSLLTSANEYRNNLMHFRLDDKIQGLEDAKKLIHIL